MQTWAAHVYSACDVEADPSVRTSELDVGGQSAGLGAKRMGAVAADTGRPVRGRRLPSFSNASTEHGLVDVQSSTGRSWAGRTSMDAVPVPSAAVVPS